MNSIAAVILVFLVLEFTLRLVADVLNLGNLTEDQSIGVWCKYVVDAASDGYTDDTFDIGFTDS